MVSLGFLFLIEDFKDSALLFKLNLASQSLLEAYFRKANKSLKSSPFLLVSLEQHPRISCTHCKGEKWSIPNMSLWVILSSSSETSVPAWLILFFSFFCSTIILTFLHFVAPRPRSFACVITSVCHLTQLSLLLTHIDSLTSFRPDGRLGACRSRV